MEKIYKIGFELEMEYTHAEWHWLENYGDIVSDGSLRHCNTECEQKDRSLVEFRSKPYVGLSSFDEFFTDLAAFDGAGHRHFNHTMGFHIHVSFRDEHNARVVNPQTLQSPAFLTYFYDRLSKEFPFVLATRKDNRFCRVPARDQYISTIITDDRYQGVNYCAIRKHKTIEFRIFPADTVENMKKYLAFVQDCVNHFLTESENLEHYSEAWEPLEKMVLDTDSMMVAAHVGRSAMQAAYTLMANKYGTPRRASIEREYKDISEDILRLHKLTFGDIVEGVKTKKMRTVSVKTNVKTTLSAITK